MRYIDFDDVLIGTGEALFAGFKNGEHFNGMAEEDKIKHIQQLDWNVVINSAPILSESIFKLKSMDPTKSCILTKVHSLEEGTAKIRFLRNSLVKQSVILVPYYLRKIDVVEPCGNILIDDSLKNLMEWEMQGGYPMFFDLYENNIDAWGQENIYNYQRVRRIDEEVKK